MTLNNFALYRTTDSHAEKKYKFKHRFEPSLEDSPHSLNI